MRQREFQWYFLIVVLLIYAAVLLFIPEKGAKSVETSIDILMKILPAIVAVLVLTIIIDRYLRPKDILNRFGTYSGIKGWILSILAGIIIVGPVYLWYPLLGRLMREDVRPGFVAAFLYARAIKIQFIPLLAIYFGLEYVAILTGLMIVASFVIGALMDLLLIVFPPSRS